MRCRYLDIRDRLGEPRWFDEAGVPRYCEFHPDECANIYANEAVLLLLTCQHCGQQFRVAVTRQHELAPLYKRIMDRELEYDDPPNACCAVGSSMNGEPRKVIEYWRKSNLRSFAVRPTWKRNHKFEIDCTPDWVSARSNGNLGQ